MKPISWYVSGNEVTKTLRVKGQWVTFKSNLNEYNEYNRIESERITETKQALKEVYKRIEEKYNKLLESIFNT